MTRGLYRFQASGQSHCVTFSCHHRLPKLMDNQAREEFLHALESERRRLGARVYGFVVMPEHVHLLLSEPERGTLADLIRGVKLTSAKRRRQQLGKGDETPLWQSRYYDRNLRSYADFVEKLRYIHRNPVKRGLCGSPEEWLWSSFRHYLTGETCVVEIESEWTARRRSANER
jgi:putative transposase